MTDPRTPPPRLGQLLVETGLLDAATLEEVLVAQRTDRRRLGELLVERGILHSHQLAQMLSHQLACPWVSLTNLVLTPALLALVPREIALRWNVVPVYLRTAKGSSSLYVAIDDPTDEAALAAIAEASEMTVKPMVAAASEIHAALVAYYGADLAAPKPEEPAAAAPVTPAAKPLKPPPPMRAVPPRPVVSAHLSDPPLSLQPDEEEADVIAEAHAPIAAQRHAIVLVVQAPDAFTHACREAALAVDARVEIADLMMAAGLASAHAPFAIVVTDDVYAFDRHGLNGLALDTNAVLVVWSDDLEARQLQPLLKTALARRRG
ncbi:MAG: uncharacterized protein JWM74_3180 [Myxococcaceae bacterium]|nr:uncharacterized protein [Myxococcaceae bacterium]